MESARRKRGAKWRRRRDDNIVRGDHRRISEIRELNAMADLSAFDAVPVEIEGIIFDLDGTLIDYEGASNAALAVPLTKRGKQFSWELHAQIVGTKPEDWSRQIVEAVGLGQELTPEQYAAEYFEAIESMVSRATALDQPPLCEAASECM